MKVSNYFYVVSLVSRCSCTDLSSRSIMVPRYTHTVVSPASVGGIEETDHVSVHYTSQVSVHHDSSDDGRSSKNNCIRSTTSKLMKHCLYIYHSNDNLLNVLIMAVSSRFHQTSLSMYVHLLAIILFRENSRQMV